MQLLRGTAHGFRALLHFTFFLWLHIWQLKSVKKKKHENTVFPVHCCVVLVTPSSPTLCNPMDCSPSGCSVHGILQARVLDGLPFPSPGDLPDPGIEPGSPAQQADSLPSELNQKSWVHIMRISENRLWSDFWLWINESKVENNWRLKGFWVLRSHSQKSLSIIVFNKFKYDVHNLDQKLISLTLKVKRFCCLLFTVTLKLW